MTTNLAEITELSDYLSSYASVLGTQIAKRIKPLHVPSTDATLTMKFRRTPRPAQAHVLTAAVKQWRAGRKVAMFCADPGTGKSLIAAASCHAHADGRPYRAVVTCPPHLVEKWLREIDETIEATARIITKYREVVRINWRVKPQRPEWYILSNSTAKLGTNWKPAAVKHWNPKFEEICYCPTCYWPVTKIVPDVNVPVPLTLDEIGKKRIFCEKCRGALWQWSDMYERWPVADYLHKRAKGSIDYLVVDEVHESKGDNTAIGHSIGALAAASKRIATLTGTIIGGYAEHLFATLYRVAPNTLVDEGIEWGDKMPFSEKYGRIERRVTTVEKDKGRYSADNRQSYGTVTSQRTQKYVRPGVMPTLYGRHLIANTIFLSLDEVAADLPPLIEEIISVDMDRELAEEYQRIEDAIKQHLQGMGKKRNPQLLGMMLSVLLGYPDKSTGWGDITYEEFNPQLGEMDLIHVVTPKALNQDKIRPKEQALLEYLLAEKAAGRQCWVYTTMTNTRDVTQRLKRLCQNAGLRTEVLTSQVNTRKREEWISRHGGYLDVCISHPMLVQTGLDLFDKRGGHNFSTLAFYLTGYSTFVLRQAGCRAYRIGQTLPCKVAYFHYAKTMQARALTLMGKKLVASQAIEGKFSSEGLAAMAGDDVSMEMALAKSLIENLDDLDVGRSWAKLGAATERQDLEPVKPSLKPAGPAVEPTAEEPEPKMNARTRRLKQRFMFAG